MAYNEFAYFYDEFNGEADYDALYAHIHAKLKEHGIQDGILADLGCGTGELTLMLTQAGYDMIGIDQSEEMLCVVRDKAEQLGLSGKLLLLRQDLLKLDLYGTIRGAVSTFDTFNHIPDLDTAIANAGFFMEKGGVFLFDMNTPYKHRNVLGDNAFTELDTYYKSICDNALSMQKEAVSYKTKLDSASKKIENLTDKLQSLSYTNKELKQQNHELSQQLDAHKKVLLQYVYPDVTTKLLKEQGLIKGDVESCIKNQALSEQIISPTSSILPIETDDKIPEKQANHSSESNIIQGLFNNLEGI